jgi:hypothetical protein
MTLALQNLDLDTGKAVKPGTYRLADETYAQLLDRLSSAPGQIGRFPRNCARIF